MSDVLEWPDDHPRAKVLIRTRASILAAARRLFLRDGFARTGMEGIAAEAGIAIMTLYRHYRTKDALFTAVMIDACCGRSRDSQPPEPTNVQEARSALHDLACSIIRLLLNPDQVAIRRVVIAEGQRFPDLGRAWVENGQALGIADAEKIISVMIGSDTPSMQPRALAETFIALLDRAPQLVLVATLDPDQVDVEVEARHAVAVIESVIKATAESA